MLLSELPPHMLSPQAVILAAGVVLLSIPDGDDATDPLPAGSEPPYGSVMVQNRTGPFRIVAIRRNDRNEDADLVLGPLEGASPGSFVFAGELEELVGDLDDTSRWRLLNFLLGFCRKAFDLAENPEFASACLQLARLCAAEAAIAEPIATITRSWTVLRGPQLVPEASCFVLGPHRVHRATIVQLPGLIGYSAVERISPGDTLLAISGRPQRWTVGSASQPLKDLIRPQPDLSALRATALGALVSACPAVAGALREALLLSSAAPIQHDDPRQPIGGALDVALPDGEGRLFLRGWLRDPMHLVQGLTLRTPCGDVALPPDGLFRHRRPDIEKRFSAGLFANADRRCGFVAYVQDPSNGSCPQPTLELRLGSGARIELRPSPRQPDAAASRAAVLTSVLPCDVTDRVLDDCIGPAAAAFHRRVLTFPPAPDMVQIGRQPDNPSVSIIVPLYRNLSFLRFQLAALASDPQCRGTQLIIVLDSPEQRDEAEHLLRGLHAMHERPVLLLVMPRNLGYAAANNAGARHASGRALLLLNSDVVPSATGWLGRLETALAAPGVGAVGPKLLFDDESVQHAGLYFRRDLDAVWLNAHYHKGMPRRWPAAAAARDVPGVTGAALLVRRDLFEAVGGICEDYIIGDYEDSDFCLRIREREWRIVYVPSAELFHFERKSINLHTGYTGTLACRYNRRLHHRRWDGAISTLMARPEYRAPIRAAS